jgi:arylsulfatase A-like enzyme
MLAFNAVHNFCWQLPPDELARRGLPTYDDWKPGSGASYGEWYDDVILPNLPHGREYYLAQLELMDAEIGKLLDLLDETGQADDTLVVYTTDNGGSTCNFGDNTPLRGTKYTVWEGGIRVPMLWRWPAALPSARQTDALVSTLDLAPTLVAAAGGEVPESDGLNLLPVLNSDEDSAHTALHWDCGFQWAVRSGDWKLSWVDGTDPQVQHLSSYEHAPMGDGWHLANLTEDPAEQHNRIDDEPAVAERLQALHAAWRTEVGLNALPEAAR